MAEAFDPYHKWLGIPPEDQPPNHYRLLAINLFESDPDVIASAADQRMGHVRTFQTGRNSALSQKLLNEIAAARVCLLNAEKKADYDQQLRQGLASHRHQAGQKAGRVEDLPRPPVAASAPTGPLPRIQGPSARYGSRRKKQSWQVVAAIAVAAALCAGVVAVLSTGRGSSVPVADDTPSVSGGRPLVPGDKPPLPDDKPPASDDKPPVPDDKPLVRDNKPPVPDDKPPVPDDKPPVPAGKLPVPSIDARQKAEERIGKLFAGAPAERLLEAAGADDYDHVERFVLLTKAGDTAAAAGDVATALQAVDEIAGRYEIDVLQTKAATLAKLKDGAKTPTAFRAVAEHSLALIDEAVASGKHDLARRVAPVALSAARKAGDSRLVTRATLRFLDLQSGPVEKEQ